ncbi:hypothetical protein CC85DRAFT_203380 [Cutaneotrichosporon oleaginosum]|uniref:Uncharacterized protein n=1 Tax=Cutaneotrichosporon oleaginosum TaxID=879819 RepID=A0A0J0XUL0_9TREE|nr:uncharacterized protein CC85DRAFT_203380 [Cutaneotrichosporon oleaginosum]KLT44755.1 hypothetical protein CC85DRAFT_203380 [Cutaneotrichosporon oleaginosum]TXT07741.1 hypothetical protein COLE_04665 [Cutaneotrichosporon oleaginosum]
MTEPVSKSPRQGPVRPPPSGPLPLLPSQKHRTKTLRRAPPAPIVPPPREPYLGRIQLSPNPLSSIIQGDIYVNLLGHEAILVLGDGHGFPGAPESYFPTRQCRITLYGARLIPLEHESFRKPEGHLITTGVGAGGGVQTSKSVAIPPRADQGKETRSPVASLQSNSGSWDWLQVDPGANTYRRKTRTPRTPMRSTPNSPATRSCHAVRASEIGPPDTHSVFVTPEMFIPSRPPPLPPQWSQYSSAIPVLDSTSPPMAPNPDLLPTLSSPTTFTLPLRALCKPPDASPGYVATPGRATGLRTSKSLHNLTQTLATGMSPAARAYLATPVGPLASSESISRQIPLTGYDHEADTFRLHPWSQEALPLGGPSQSRYRTPSDSSQSSYSPSPEIEQRSVAAYEELTAPSILRQPGAASH